MPTSPAAETSRLPLPRPRRRPSAIRNGLARRLALRRIVLLAIGVALAVDFDLCWQGRVGQAPTDGENSIEVAVAGRDLAPGETITDDMIRFVVVDRADKLAGVGLRPEGRQLVQAIEAGEIITSHNLGQPDGPGLRANERAVAIAPSASPLPLQPGDHVELIAVSAANDGTARSDIIGAAVRVLSIEEHSIVLAVPAAFAPEVVRRQATGALELIGTPS